MAASKKNLDDTYIQTILSYCEMSKRHKQKRDRKRQLNWDMFNLKQNFTHKSKGQSKEFLPKLALGIENLKSTMINALTNRGDDWFNVEKGVKVDPTFTADVVRKLIGHHLSESDAYLMLANSLVYVALDGLVVGKVGSSYTRQQRFDIQEPKQDPREEFQEPGNPFLLAQPTRPKKPKPTKIEEKEVIRWGLSLDLIDYEDFYFDPEPNPSGGLFEIHAVRRDLHELIEVAETHKVYDMVVIKSINEEFERQEEESMKRRRKDEEDTEMRSFRKKVTIREMWGTLIDRNSGRVMERNVVCTIANDKYMIRPPTKNPRMDRCSPFVYSTLVDVPGSQTAKAFMDAPARLNKTLNEQYNLLLDGFFDQVKGIKQLRHDLLVDPNQVAGGIRSGMTLKIDSTAPAGVQVIEKVRTGDVPADAFNFFRYSESITDESMLSSELRAAGLPPAGTKATIASISEQNIQGLFGSLAKIFEDKFVAPLLQKVWVEILQNMESDQIADEVLINLIGEEAATRLTVMSKEERYARGALSAKFKVRGISGTFNRLREFNRLVSVLGQLGTNPDIYAEFKKDFSIKRFMGSLITASGLREDELRLTDEEKKQQQMQEQVNSMMQQALAGAQGSAQPQAQGSQSESAIQPMEGNA